MTKQTDVSSKEFQEATKIHFDSILAIIKCQQDLGQFGIPLTEYAISILQKSLKIVQIQDTNHS